MCRLEKKTAAGPSALTKPWIRIRRAVPRQLEFSFMNDNTQEK